MGEQITKAVQKPEQLKQFTHHLLKDLQALERMLAEGRFETGKERIGAEQELCLVNQRWGPAPLAMQILQRMDDHHIDNEYALFNLEINLDPLEFEGNCLTRMEDQLNGLLGRISGHAAELDAHVALVGILPTIRNMDLCQENMTPLPRYHTLNENLKRMRGGTPFNFHITGTDELISQHATSWLESCNTSFQVHYQTTPERFVDHYNFAQLISAPLLAASSNSALLFGKRLWKETRIALFQQSIDTRHMAHPPREQSPRVTFGKNWVKNSVLEIYQDDLSRFPMIIYPKIEEDALKTLDAGKVPRLRALCLFNGTVYRWNRACYGISDGKPHLRIENRILPSGPSVVDEIANTAFWCGMMKAMPQKYQGLQDKLSFDLARTNFFRAAKMGLDAHFNWLNEKTITARDLIVHELLPMAGQGLRDAKIDPEDISRLLEIVTERVERRHTGGTWLFESFNKLINEGTRYEAAVALTAGMVRRQKAGTPVHQWDLANMEDAGLWRNKFWCIEQIMATDLYTLQEEDLVELAVHIMNWKNIRHIPIENKQGELAGLVSVESLLKYFGKFKNIKMKTVKDIMVKDPVTVSPETETLKAVKLMHQHELSCLLVTVDNHLVGMVTEYDFTRITAELLKELSDKNQTEVEDTASTL